MTVTAAQIAQVRRMVAEPTDAIYTDEAIEDYITAYPLTDENGEPPRVVSEDDEGVMETNEDWTPTYDLHAAAADIWDEKAAALAEEFDLTADGATMHRSNVVTHAMQQARMHRSRRSVRTIIMVPNVARERTDEVDE